MRGALAAGLLLVLLAGASRDAAALAFSTVRAGQVPVTVATVDLRHDDLRLFLLDARGAPLLRLDAAADGVASRGGRLAFAMNAGMFRPDHLPVGLFVADGAPAFALDTHDGDGNFFLKPNGVFLVGPDGARIVETSAYPGIAPGVKLATQSGPLLVHQGRLHPAFRAGSTSVHVRNGVGVVSPDVVVFAISEAPLNFHAFATLFRDALHCREALYLDGTVSSLYAPALHRQDARAELGPIIGVVEPLRQPANRPGPAPPRTRDGGHTGGQGR